MDRPITLSRSRSLAVASGGLINTKQKICKTKHILAFTFVDNKVTNILTNAGIQKQYVIGCCRARYCYVLRAEPHCDELYCAGNRCIINSHK